MPGSTWLYAQWACAEGLDVDDTVLDAQIRRLVAGPGRHRTGCGGHPPTSETAMMRKVLDHSGRLQDLRADLVKSAALAWIEERMVLVDKSGIEISADLVDMIERYSEQGQD